MMRLIKTILLLLVAATSLAFVSVAAGRHHDHSAQPAPSLFGMNTGTYDSSYSRFLRDMPTAKRMGARWIHLTGANIKYTRKGKLTFSQMDSQVNRARRMGLGVLMSLGGIRRACSIHHVDPTVCPPRTKHQLKVYARYLRRLLKHFKGRVTYYESWVEPNHKSFWPTGPNPDEYARLLETEYSAFEKAAPQAKLLFAGVADFGIESGDAVLPYTDHVLNDLRGAKAFDGVALHGYRYPPTLSPDDEGYTHYPSSPVWRKNTWAEQLSAYEHEFESHGYGEPPLWLSEFGWPGNAKPGSGRPANYYPGIDSQANDVAQAYRTLERLPFVQAAFWFNLRDYHAGVKNPDPGFFAHYGLLYSNFGHKPAATQFEYFAHGGH